MANSEDALMKAVLAQIGMNNLDYDKLATDIGAPNGQAARKRWGRLFDKLSGGASKTATPRSASKPTGVKKNVKAKTPPAKKAANGKKGKAVKAVKDEEGTEDGEETPSDEPVTPTPRKLPGRKGRVEQFKNESEVETEDADTSLDAEDEATEEA